MVGKLIIWAGLLCTIALQPATAFYPCGVATSWTRHHLGHLGFEVLIGKSKQLNERNYFDAFCCCSERGMRLLSPLDSTKLVDLYNDFVVIGLLNNASVIFTFAWTAFSTFESETINQYGQQSQTQVENGMCLALQKNGDTVTLEELPCGNPVEVYQICRAYDQQPSHKTADSCFTRGYHCNEDNVRKYFKTQVCPRDRANTFAYPDVKRDESVEDDYYGVQVKDPYRWLENPDAEDPEMEKFVQQQNDVFQEYIKETGRVAEIAKDLEPLYAYPDIAIPQRYGNRLFTFEYDSLLKQNILYVRDSQGGKPRIVLDVNTNGEDSEIRLLEFAEDGNRIAYGLTTDSEWLTIYTRDVNLGLDFPEPLIRVKNTDIAWSHSCKGFFYARYPLTDDGTNYTRNQNQKIYYHTVGTIQNDDVMVAEFLDQPDLILGHNMRVTKDGKYLIFYPYTTPKLNAVYYVALSEQPIPGTPTTLNIVPLVTEFTDNFEFITNEGTLFYFRTNKGAVNYKIITIDITAPEEAKWKTIVAEDATDIIRFAKAVYKKRLLVDKLSNAKSKLELRKISDGSLVSEIPLDIGAINYHPRNPETRQFYFKFTSFLTPGILYFLDFTQPKTANVPKVIKHTVIKGFDPSYFTVSQAAATSEDGTKIPMFVVQNRYSNRTGKAPTLLTAFGGFGINFIPNFQPDKAAFVQNFDGIFVSANVRGGGEYGDKWYTEGSLLAKQTSLDDFQAVAKFLVSQDYTNREKLIIQGCSHGGLLVSASVNQNPGLFGAAVAQSGLHDMLRFNELNTGIDWCGEYGCANDGDQSHFDNLLKYSPLHNVVYPEDDSMGYPAVLLTTADNYYEDNYIAPAHSYKLISELQNKILPNAADIALMLRTEVEYTFEDGPVKRKNKKVQEAADIFAFLIRVLKLKYKEPELCDEK